MHFIHIRKTGGMAIKHALRQYPITRKYKFHLHDGHSYKLSDVPKGEKAFFVLREPISRFISGFYSRQREGMPRVYVPWNTGEKVAFGLFNTPDELARSLSSGDQRTRDAAQDAMKSIRHVNSSYSDWLENEDYLKTRLGEILMICFQERLNNDFAVLKHTLGLPEEAELPRDEVKAHKNPAGLDTFLENEAIQNLKKWYAADYDFYAVCKEYARQINPRPPKSLK